MIWLIILLVAGLPIGCVVAVGLVCLHGMFHIYEGKRNGSLDDLDHERL